MIDNTMELLHFKFKEIKITEQVDNTHYIVFIMNDYNDADNLHKELFQQVKILYEYKENSSFLVIEFILEKTNKHFYATVDISESKYVLEWFKKHTFTHIAVFFQDDKQQPTLLNPIIPL